MALRAVLSMDERERAAHFQLPELSNRWTIGRAAVRSILATYAGSEPQSLAFRVGPYGKPELAGSKQSISFNFSRTRDRALLAVADECRIGIDAETVHADIDIEGISRRFFACAEAAEILELAPTARLRAFFACWTRKEAFVKAIGGGLSVPLNSFQVTVRADQPARLISVDWYERERWSLVDLSQPGIAAAVAVEGQSAIVRRFEFCPPPGTTT
jgi:4'-phosphopantetheinyl transferase